MLPLEFIDALASSVKYNVVVDISRHLSLSFFRISKRMRSSIACQTKDIRTSSCSCTQQCTAIISWKRKLFRFLFYLMLLFVCLHLSYLQRQSFRAPAIRPSLTKVALTLQYKSLLMIHDGDVKPLPVTAWHVEKEHTSSCYLVSRY